MLSVLIPNKCEANILELVAEIEEKIPAAQIIIAVDRYSKGKGWAMREAFKLATGKHIAFLDGDRDIEPRMLKRLLPFLDDFDAVVGSKRIWKAPFHRKVITHLSRAYIRLMFGLTCDTQTGIKLFRKSALRLWKTDGYAFDIEILKSINDRKLKIIEVPIEASITKPMSMRAVWKTLKESMRIKFQS